MRVFFGGGVIKLGEMAKDHHVPVEENYVVIAVSDGIGASLLDEDGSLCQNSYDGCRYEWKR